MPYIKNYDVEAFFFLGKYYSFCSFKIVFMLIF